MIVAGRKMRVAAQRALLAPHDQQHLRVRLVADDAVDDLHAGFLQPVREAKVRFLVEARAQLDDDRDVLALARRFDQLIDER